MKIKYSILLVHIGVKSYAWYELYHLIDFRAWLVLIILLNIDNLTELFLKRKYGSTLRARYAPPSKYRTKLDYEERMDKAYDNYLKTNYTKVKEDDKNASEN